MSELSELSEMTEMAEMAEMTHVDSQGKAKMVDVSSKSVTERVACAYAQVILPPSAFQAIKSNSLKKGDALTVAKLAGIAAAKKTSELIPLCHNIFISNVEVTCSLKEESSSVKILTKVNGQAQTGFEMEAMVAASVAALTVYDMCKGIDKSIEISKIHLVSKSGGKSGAYKKTQA